MGQLKDHFDDLVYEFHTVLKEEHGIDLTLRELRRIVKHPFDMLILHMSSGNPIKFRLHNLGYFFIRKHGIDSKVKYVKKQLGKGGVTKEVFRQFRRIANKAKKYYASINIVKETDQ